MSDLKPCPFCGSSDTYVYPSIQAPDLYGCCDACGTTTRFVDTEADAIEAWNQRPPEAEALRTKLQALVKEWRVVGDGPIDSAREHGARETYLVCATELERALQEARDE